MPDTQTNGETPTANTSDISTAGLRNAIQAWLGASLYDDRELYETFDWPKDVDDERYYATYTRHPFAKPVVDRPAFTSWRDEPDIVDPEADDESDFEAKMRQANRAHDVWSYAERLDRLAGIGRYGVMVFVTSDVDGPETLATPLEASAGGEGLDFVQQIKVFSEVSVDSIEWGDASDAAEGRWGKPVAYHIDFSPEASTDKTGTEDDAVYEVHHSRTVAAPATRKLDDEFFGRPRLEPVFNVLRDIEKVLGSVAEMAYRGADKGLAIQHDPDQVNVGSDEFWEQHNEEIRDWFQGIKPVFETTGSVTELGGQIANVSNVFQPQLSALAAATGIPKRVFEGDPAGALASAAEDTQAYFGMIEERRGEYVTPHYARPIVRWYIERGVVSEPDSGTVGQGKFLFDVEWDPLRVLSEQEQANVVQTQLDAGERNGVTVREYRDMIGLEPSPDWLSEDIANSFLSEVGGGGGGPGAALDDALAQNRERAEAAARTESRIQRGQEADD